MMFSFLNHLRTQTTPLALHRKKPLAWDDEELHHSTFDRDPEGYALAALAQGVTGWQQARILMEILRRSWVGIPDDSQKTLAQVAALLTALLEPEQTLTVFLALRRLRANHKHTSRAIVRWVVNHPGLEDLAVCRRPAVADCLEHALGKATIRAIARQANHEGTEWASRAINPLLFNPDRVKAILPFLFHLSSAQPTAQTLYPVAHTLIQRIWRPTESLPGVVTPTNRGNIAATLVHLYRGGTTPELVQAIETYVIQAAAGLPVFSGRLTVVLDASASSRGYGDREFCCISQSVAFQRVLATIGSQTRTITVGGQGEPPIPNGPTDLATAVLDAVADHPDLVVVLSDGYENTCQGDLAAVVAALPAAGCDTPVVFCHSKFSHSDDLQLRRPANNLTALEFWHEREFPSLVERLWCLARGNQGWETLKDHWRTELFRWHKELMVWTRLD
ncbi:MAG TPA: VWA domain-containing protein [Acidobacteriota bacterium]|nr:VWA domain-containing protein [Acidobacteriota bacterium]